MQWTSVALVMGEHWITGLLATEHRRVLDILNDKTSEFLTLAEVRLYQGSDLGEPLFALPRSVVPKARIALLLITEERHEAPARRATNFVRKDHYEVFLTVPGLEVKGYVHLTQRVDPIAFLSRLGRDGVAFFPVTDATVSQLGPFGEPAQAPVAVVNRQSVNLFYLGDAPSVGLG